MKLFAAVICLAVVVPASAALQATLTKHNGQTAIASFIIMKDDVVYVEFRKPDGSIGKAGIHKSKLRSVVFDNGKELDLSATNSPPELNHRTAYVKNEYADYERKDNADIDAWIELMAVNRLTTAGLDGGEGYSLTNALRSELGGTGKFRVMERSEMEEVLKEQGFQQSGACDEASCAVEIGRVLAVRYMVLGHIGRVGKTFTVNVRLVDVGSGEIVKDISRNHRGSPERLLTRVVPSVAREMAGVSGVRKLGRRFWIPAAGVAAASGIVIGVLAGRSGGGGGSGEPDVETGGVRVKW